MSSPAPLPSGPIPPLAPLRQPSPSPAVDVNRTIGNCALKRPTECGGHGTPGTCVCDCDPGYSNDYSVSRGQSAWSSARCGGGAAKLQAIGCSWRPCHHSTRAQTHARKVGSHTYAAFPCLIVRSRQEAF